MAKGVYQVGAIVVFVGASGECYLWVLSDEYLDPSWAKDAGYLSLVWAFVECAT